MILPQSPLPEWLKPSGAVDIAQLWFRVRPAMRTELRLPVRRDTVFRWARRFGFLCALDEDRFLTVSRDGRLARDLLVLDRSSVDHTYRLGIRLGYPRCCCLKAASIGESGLDDWAGTWRTDLLCGAFRLIDPTGYVEGKALISHIPCSPRCRPSLDMAQLLLRAMQPSCLDRWHYDFTRRPCQRQIHWR